MDQNHIDIHQTRIPDEDKKLIELDDTGILQYLFPIHYSIIDMFMLVKKVEVKPSRKNISELKKAVTLHYKHAKMLKDMVEVLRKNKDNKLLHDPVVRDKANRQKFEQYGRNKNKPQ